jgi:phosphoribosylglycinamide formyltransferase-1
MGVDTVVLLGYLYLLTRPMLEAFPGRIVNLHDSDLTLVDVNGERLYVGLHSTRDAITAGESETRSSVHFVTPKLDSGPVFLLSERYPVAPFARSAAPMPMRTASG